MKVYKDAAAPPVMFKDRDLRKLCEDSFSRVKHDMDQLNVKQTDQQKEMDQMKEKLLNLYGMLTDMQAALADPVKKEGCLTERHLRHGYVLSKYAPS